MMMILPSRKLFKVGVAAGATLLPLAQVAALILVLAVTSVCDSSCSLIQVVSSFTTIPSRALLQQTKSTHSILLKMSNVGSTTLKMSSLNAGANAAMSIEKNHPSSQPSTSSIPSVTTTSKTLGDAQSYDYGKDEDVFTWTKQWYPIMPIKLLEESSSLESSTSTSSGSKRSSTPPMNKPRQVTVLGRKLVIWNNGRVGGDDNNNDDDVCDWTVMEDICPHRRAPLSTGKMLPCKNDEQENTIMCRFHGWEFNSSGNCVKIPMQLLNDDDATATKDPKQTNVTNAITFPCQVKGGLLWVFMDETVDKQNLPTLSKNAYISDNNKTIQCNFYVFPVSYMSMIENSLDPSHAPFVHEGISEFGGRMYTPDSAIPITRYGLVNGTKSTKMNGFILEHTPYMTDPKHPNTTENSVTTRQFIPPCSQVTKSTYFGVHLYFVPSTPRETIVITTFALSVPANTFSGNKLKQMALRVIPKSWNIKYSNMVKDFMHFAFVKSTRQVQFNAQDTLTMQGQDYNKGYHRISSTSTSKDGGDGTGTGTIVLDVLPTPADNGVSMFQRWIKRYAKGYGPFGTMSKHDMTISSSSSSTSTQYQPTQSLWDAHAKYCPICQRSIKRLSLWSTLAQKISMGLLVSCAVTLLLSTIVNLTSAGCLLKILYGGLLSAFALQLVSFKLRHEVESIFVSHANAHHPKNDLLFEPYAP